MLVLSTRLFDLVRVKLQACQTAVKKSTNGQEGVGRRVGVTGLLPANPLNESLEIK
jgi:hypothetical protein